MYTDLAYFMVNVQIFVKLITELDHLVQKLLLVNVFFRELIIFIKWPNCKQ